MTTVPAVRIDEIFDSRSPEPCGLSRPSIVGIAERLSSNLDYARDRDVGRVVRALGGRIVHADMLGGAFRDRGSLEVRGDGSFEIMIPRHTGPTRDRFTAAHDLGHLVLHHLWPNRNGTAKARTFSAGFYGRGRAETEANWFAFAFLMPEPAFRNAMRTHGERPWRLAHEFGTEPFAAKIRMDWLLDRNAAPTVEPDATPIPTF